MRACCALLPCSPAVLACCGLLQCPAAVLPCCALLLCSPDMLACCGLLRRGRAARSVRSGCARQAAQTCSQRLAAVPPPDYCCFPSLLLPAAAGPMHTRPRCGTVQGCRRPKECVPADAAAAPLQLACSSAPTPSCGVCPCPLLQLFFNQAQLKPDSAGKLKKAVPQLRCGVCAVE